MVQIKPSCQLENNKPKVRLQYFKRQLANGKADQWEGRMILILISLSPLLFFVDIWFVGSTATLKR